MNTIHVQKLSETTYQVTVEARSNTTHYVTVQPEYAQSLTVDKADVSHLLLKSFEFLLEREPNTSILRSFDLTVISRYFPEYERVIRDKL